MMLGAPWSSLPAGGPQTEHDTIRACHPNIVLVGETGVGKSSLINLIASHAIAPTSNDALGCTIEHYRYDVTLPCDVSMSTSGSDSGASTVTVSLWDTAGLEEGTYGAVPAATSAAHLTSLLHTLALSPSGVHLVLFCIRGTARVTHAQSRQYERIYVGTCRKKVPIALVVTGLEHLGLYEERPGMGMEQWWVEHRKEVERLGMVFDMHACVTAMEVVGNEGDGDGDGDGVGRERWIASQRRLRELLVESTGPGTVPWRIEPRRSVVVAVAELCRVLRIQGRASRGEAEKNEGSNIYRFYMALRQWIAVMARVIAGSYHSLLEGITR